VIQSVSKRDGGRTERGGERERERHRGTEGAREEQSERDR